MGEIGVRRADLTTEHKMQSGSFLIQDCVLQVEERLA